MSGLTPPGPHPPGGNGWPASLTGATPPGFQPPPPPPPPPAPASGDSGLAWTGFGLSFVWCVPLLPLAAVVLGILTLARRRFGRRWVPIVAILLGVLGTVLQAFAVPPTVEAVQEALEAPKADTETSPAPEEPSSSDDPSEDPTTSAAPSGPTPGSRIVPLRLSLGDCFDSPELLEANSDDELEVRTVTLQACDTPHDLEVYAEYEVDVEGEEFPGADVIAEEAIGCLPRFEDFVGMSYQESVLEVYHFFPTETSWDTFGDREILCMVTEPGRQVSDTLRDAQR